MIHTAKQLKDKVKNLSGGNSDVAQTLIRNYIMERFLERLSLSEYRNNFILKGGMLVASIVGVDMRATMDIDTTVKALPLNEQDARRIVEGIFKVKIEDRRISVLTYNLETLLAEKMQTILARGLANTRMRDFYDIYEIMTIMAEKVDINTLKEAFDATCRKRQTVFEKEEIGNISEKVERDSELAEMWERYKGANYFVGELDWIEVVGFDIEYIRRVVE